MLAFFKGRRDLAAVEKVPECGSKGRFAGSRQAEYQIVFRACPATT
jgi:hypothetical protein